MDYKDYHYWKVKLCVKYKPVVTIYETSSDHVSAYHED